MITGYKNKVFTYYAFDENFKLTFDECPQLSLAKAYKKGRHLVLPEALDWIGNKSIIFMKEEAGKRFSLNPEEVPSLAYEKESFDLRVENTRLKEENEILKQKLEALLTFIKDHKEA
jgi:hypothetical protein